MLSGHSAHHITSLVYCTIKIIYPDLHIAPKLCKGYEWGNCNIHSKKISNCRQQTERTNNVNIHLSEFSRDALCLVRRHSPLVPRAVGDARRPVQQRFVLIYRALQLYCQNWFLYLFVNRLFIYYADAWPITNEWLTYDRIRFFKYCFRCLCVDCIIIQMTETTIRKILAKWIIPRVRLLI